MTRREILSGLTIGSLVLGLWSLMITFVMAMNATVPGVHFGWIGWAWAFITAVCAAVGGFAAGAES